MQEGVVEVLALVDGHAAVVPRLAVEDGVDGDQGAAEDGAADEHLAQRRGLLALDGGRLLHVAAGGVAEGIAGGEEGRGRRARRCPPGEGRLGGCVDGSGELGDALRQARGRLADCHAEGHLCWTCVSMCGVAGRYKREGPRGVRMLKRGLAMEICRRRRQ